MSSAAVFGRAVFGVDTFGVSIDKVTIFSTLADFITAVEQMPDTDFIQAIVFREVRTYRRKIVLIRR